MCTPCDSICSSQEEATLNGLGTPRKRGKKTGREIIIEKVTVAITFERNMCFVVRLGFWGISDMQFLDPIGSYICVQILIIC